ncbi:MAG: protein kinase [Kiritimatiellaeota bacterium]|nr:protein kinase [Kiritimatiellota bacterium]
MNLDDKVLSFGKGHVMPVLEGQALGNYEILAKLGQGGMGAVYKARDIRLQRSVAIKVLPVQLAADAEFLARFQREAIAAAQFNHQNLVQVYDIGEAGGTHYIVMELVEGESLGQRLARKGALEPREALALVVYVAQALAYAWDKAKLIHRDIKPANIFLSDDGAVKLGDLGLAKSLQDAASGLTLSGTVMGTPQYMSPEQGNAEKDLDFRSDIYSLGCVLFHALAGQPPFQGDTTASLIYKHVHAPPPSLRKVLPDCPAPLAQLLAKMLAKKPVDRPQSYAELIAELQQVYRLLPATADAVTVVQEPMTRKPALYVVSGLAGLALLAGLWIWAPWKPSTTFTPVASLPVAAADATLVLQLDFTRPPEKGVVQDQSGHGNDGHVEGAIWVSDSQRIGALRFDSLQQTQCVRVANTAVLNPKRLTITAWIKSPPPAAEGHWNRIADKDSERGYNLCLGGRFRPRIDWSGHVGLEVGRDHVAFSDLPVADDLWHHISATYDGNEQRLYVDGQPRGPGARWQGDIPATDCDLVIGNKQPSNPDTASAFNGLIGGLRIYNRALSAAELVALAGPAQATPASVTKAPLLGPPLWANFMQQARQTPLAQWAEWKQGLLAGIRRNVGGRSSDTAAVDRALTAIGQILDEARVLSDPEFTNQKPALLERWGQAMRSAMGRSPPAQ